MATNPGFVEGLRNRAGWMVLAAAAFVAALVGSPGGAPAPPPAGTPAVAPPAIANPHGDLRVACEACHTAESWSAMRVPSTFAHDSTGFALEGKHRTAACKDCHRSLQFARVATSCADCHRDVHEGRNGRRCQDCHVPIRWTDHSEAVRRHASTRFPLRGVHAVLECTRCHTGAGEEHLTPVPSQCASCHANEYAATRNPNHAAAGFGTNCEGCHDPARATWSGTGFDHTATGFALTGAHRAQACTACHTGGRYSGLSRDCYACHRPDYERVRDPDHIAAGFPTACATCHGTSTWDGALFDHARTRFPLTGAHRSQTCNACHGGGQYAGTPMDCVACHRAQYDATQNPNHAAANFPTTCATCHSTTAWEPAAFDHATTRFPLTGAHRTQSCTACHGNGQYAGTPMDCVACHRAQYEGAQSPNHLAAGFGTACASCHTTTAWRPSTFDHERFFRIDSGAHRGRWSSCTQCHSNPGNYREFTCLTCHGATETNDHHREVTGYRYESTACYSCHRNV